MSSGSISYSASYLAKAHNLNSGQSSTFPIGTIIGNPRKVIGFQNGKQFVDPALFLKRVPPRELPLSVVEIMGVVSFLKPEELWRCRVVSCSFEDAIGCLWENQCRERLEVPPGEQLDKYLEPGMSIQDHVKNFLLNNIWDERFYEPLIGKVDPAPPISKSRIFERWNETDPCDTTKKICKAYILAYLPAYMTITKPGIYLDKEDDQNNPIAPKLRRRKVIPGKVQENITLRVPVTIYNLIEIYGNQNHMSCCDISPQQENARIQARWICMRKDVIGLGRSSAEQDDLAQKNGVVISDLLPRFFFNLIQRNLYPNRQDPLIFQRTSTRSEWSLWAEKDSCFFEHDFSCYLGCATGLWGSSSPLKVMDGPPVERCPHAGAAVELPIQELTRIKQAGTAQP